MGDSVEVSAAHSLCKAVSDAISWDAFVLSVTTV